MKQHTHYTSEFRPQKFPIILVCDGISNAANIGSLFRISDAFGIEKLIFCGETFSLGRRFKKTSRSTEQYVNYSIEKNIQKVLMDLKSKGHVLIALEITSHSQSLSNFKMTEKPLVLIVGNEITGVSEAVLNMVDKTIHIDMFGVNSSMNVANSTSIALFSMIQNHFIN